MKKIFRMALVFALAGATLMYTGCTKDYGEDIDNLDAKLSSVQDQLSKQLADLQTEVSNLRSSVSSLESAYKAADELIKGDVSDLKTRVGKLEDQVKDLNKYATKDELKEAREALEKKITDEIAALKADILKVTDDLAKEIADLKEELKKKADAEDVEAKLKALEDAQAEVDAVYGFLSDELRSIVFLPDFYFAGIEATSYDFGSFIGYLIYGNPYAATSFYYDEDEGEIMNWTQNTPSTETKYTFPNGVKWMTDLYYETDAKGYPVYYKYDPETYEWVLKDGKMVKGKEGDDNVRMYFPANHLQGQIGLANYNLNPSSFPVDSAEWRLNGRNVKYKLKAEEEETWYPVFEGISASNGLATVKYSIDNPEKIYSSILGAVIDCAINLYNRYRYDEDALEEIEDTFIDAIIQRPTAKLASGTHYNWMEQAQNELLAKEYRYNNVPTMQLVATLGDGREIVSDWHALSSEEELVSHLAFAADNAYVTNWYDCGLSGDEEAIKDLYMDAQWCVVEDPSVPVKWNGGPVDLQKLVAIHTSDYMGGTPLAEYSLDEFLAKYPGYHFEFELLPYNIGGNSTSEDMYGKLEGSMFTPCYVESAGGKATSIPIAKDSEDGISAVGRMPVVLVTLVNDETKDIHAFGWFKIIISKDAKPAQFFEIPDLGKVPYICSNYALTTKWHEFSYFVLEKLKVDYQQFIGTYKFEGAWVYANVLENGKVVKKLVPTTVTTEGVLQNVNFENYNSSKKVYETSKWGTAMYKKDESGSGINDAFTWNVNPTKVGEGKTQSLYFKFVSGDSVVYFEMKADVAKKAKMYFASNKTNNLWFADIDNEPINTVRISVPVPDNTKSLTVMDFKKNLFEFFNGNPGQPVLGLVAEESDPIYAAIYNDTRNRYRSELLATKSVFQFSKTQPTIATAAERGYNTQLFVKSWKDDDTAEDYTKLYAVKYQRNWMGMWEPIMDEFSDGKGGYTKQYRIFEDQLVATITEGEENGYVIEYADTDVAKLLLNLWSYKTNKQENMLYANITAKNKYGSTACVSVDDGNFHVRFIRPIDIDFAAQDIAEESQVDGANVNVINFFEGITDWNNQPVVRKHMVDVLDKDGNPVIGEDGKTKKEWDGTYEEVVLKTINMYKYYDFQKIRIDVGGAQRNNFDTSNPSKWGIMAAETPAHMLFLGSVDEDGKFTETTETPIVTPNPSANPPVYNKIYEVDITDFNELATFVLNYKNTQGYADTFQIRVPVEIDYSWGTLKEYLVINIKDTGATEPGE